jgi:hypothetical protein
MAFIPPEIGVGVKNRFTYSEIHTLQGGFLPGSGPGMSTLAVAGFGNSSIPNAFAKSLLPCGRHQHGDLVLTKRGKMAMDSSVPAKN